MYDYSENGTAGGAPRSLPQQAQPTTPCEADDWQNSGAMHIGRRRSSVRLIPTNSIDEKADRRQADNLAHSKSLMRRRSSLLAQAAAAANSTGQPPQRQLWMMGGMWPGQPMHLQQQQQQAPLPPLPAAAVKEGTSPQKKVAAGLTGPPPGSAVKRRASQYRAKPQDTNAQMYPTREVEPSTTQWARRPSVVAAKAKQRSRRRNHSETPLSNEENKADNSTPPPPSLMKRLSLFFKPVNARRRSFKEEAEDESNARKSGAKKRASKATPDSGEDEQVEKHARNTLWRKDGGRRKSSSVSPVPRMSAVEVVPQEDPNEKALEELDTILEKRMRAMGRSKSVRRTQSFFGNFSAQKDDEDDDENGNDDRTSSSSTTSGSRTPSAAPEDHHRVPTSSSTPDWEEANVMDPSKATGSGQGRNYRSGKEAMRSSVSPLPRAGSGGDTREQRYSVNAADSDGTRGSSEDSSSSSSNEDATAAKKKSLARSSPPGNDYAASSFFKAETSQATNGESPSPANPPTMVSGAMQPPQQRTITQLQQQPGPANRWRAAPVPYMPDQQQQQQRNFHMPSISPQGGFRRQTVPGWHHPVLSPNPHQLQKRMSTPFMGNNMAHPNGMMYSSVPPLDAAMALHAQQRGLMGNPQMTPMMMRYPMPPQDHPMAMQQPFQQQQQQQQQQRRE